jgi:L-lactate dehydrogenase complex protein LldG
MDSRERIVGRLKAARVKNDRLPEAVITPPEKDALQKLTAVLQGIGGTVVMIARQEEIAEHLLTKFLPAGRWINLVSEVVIPKASAADNDPHMMENVQLAILGGTFAVAENGAVWLTSEAMGDRALPFICEHLALVVRQSNVVDTMRDAYARIGSSSYDFGTFIAGPSKTADIEQSLVLGAHGPKSLTLFLTA